MTKRCSVWWCENKYYANGYCKAHDTATKRFGSPYGKHKSQMTKVSDEILKARLIAIKVTEFVGETEFGQVTDEETSQAVKEFARMAKKSLKCPFCDGVGDEHKPLCIVKLSKSLLEETYPHDEEEQVCKN